MIEEIINFTSLHPYALGCTTLTVAATLAGLGLYKYTNRKTLIPESESQEIVPLNMQSAKTLFDVDYEAWPNEPDEGGIVQKAVKNIELDGLVARTVGSMMFLKKFHEAYTGSELRDPDTLEPGSNSMTATKNVFSIYIGKYVAYQIGLTMMYPKDTPEFARISSYLNSKNLAVWADDLCKLSPGVEGFKEWIKLWNIHIANFVNVYEPNKFEYRILIHTRNFDKYCAFINKVGLGDVTYCTKHLGINQLDNHVAAYNLMQKMAEEVVTKIPPEVVIKATDVSFWSKVSAVTKNVLAIFF